MSITLQLVWLFTLAIPGLTRLVLLSSGKTLTVCGSGLKDKVRIVYPIENFSYGMREFAIRDSGGYILQFGKPIEKQSLVVRAMVVRAIAGS